MENCGRFGFLTKKFTLFPDVHIFYNIFTAHKWQLYTRSWKYDVKICVWLCINFMYYSLTAYFQFTWKQLPMHIQPLTPTHSHTHPNTHCKFQADYVPHLFLLWISNDIIQHFFPGFCLAFLQCIFKRKTEENYMFEVIWFECMMKIM